MRRAVRRWWLCGLVVGLAATGHAPAGAQDQPADGRAVAATSTAVSGSAAPLAPVGGGLAEQVEALRLEVAELRTIAQATAGETPPPWAAALREQLDERIERVAVMQERLAARIETPTPRLTEPIVLFTVAGCMLLFGFIVGRGVQRRSARRDSRLRL